MLDYRDIIIKSYSLHWSGSEIAKQAGVSKSGVNDFLKTFKECPSLTYPLPEGITNFGIAELVYGKSANIEGRDLDYELPDFEEVNRLMVTRKNMTLTYLWRRYQKSCSASGGKYYQ